ncbi:O-Glycosyl hydrolase family 30 [Agrilactobacillus composti DSM 18527 = JCM 14202]|uniref:O-Glycosyl hydrolase family 30 n=1 Tax=Agrilactobacillus composti DSM 18527 = JCM 14202 TaxID=1423734 RepID=A0A0R1Y272_9LACO|nr:glycoside hydrolase family 30 beta sandwich domain-containing protein [Agrilactobacillus composti]KRM36303.1 O-Glycosyl hydrolase family 30 [Agrilactobacillus composti DSM 18527 = JCM 14202]
MIIVVNTTDNSLFPTEFWTVTAGDLSQKRAHLTTPTPEATPGDAAKIVIDPADKHQNWIGAGAAITDAAASLIWQQSKAQRNALLHELFDPKEGNFATIRIPLGSCEPASQPYYSYDDVPFGEHDASLAKFSIGTGTPGAPDATKDLKYIVPVVQEILKINPAVKIMASPWSAPAWMKNTGELKMGGHLRFGEYTGNGYDQFKDTFESVYAQYFIHYLEAYKKLGIPIYAITIQNEPSNAAAWPAMIWKLPELADFGYTYLRPALDKTFPNTKIYFWDGSLNVLTEPLSKYVTPEQASAFDGFAFHTYDGPYTNLFKGSRSFPHWDLAMTERRCMIEETPEDASHIMFGLIGNWLVRQGLSMINLWNMALDERGLPNMVGSTGRRGVVTIDHTTGKVQRNLEYYMLRNFGQDVVPGSTVIGSSSYTQDGYTGGLGSVAFLAPDGGITAHLYNPTDQPLEAAVTVNGQALTWQHVTVPAWGTVTLHKAFGPVNASSPRADEAFKLNPYPANLADDEAPGKGVNKNKK